MATTPTNILKLVQTYQRSGLAFLINLNCFLGDICNAKFKDFEKIGTNLGSSVTFDRPPRFTVSQGLVASFQSATQLVQTLSCTQSANSSFAFTAQERIFNVEKEGDEYIDIFGESSVKELANVIETDIANQVHSGVLIQTGSSSGQLQTDSGPYRFFGDGSTAINSYQQLAQMIANFKNFGSVHNGIKVILPDTSIPAIIGTGLNQFALNRNNEIAMSWQVGEFGYPPVMYYQSNLLPMHVSGNVGNGAPTNTLTVVSTNDPTGNNITQITFSGATNNDANAIFSGDLAQFVDGVSGQPDLRFITYTGDAVSSQPVQFRVLSNASAGNTGQVTVSVTPALTINALNKTSGAIQINNNIVAGMKAQFLPTHRCGLVVGGDAFFLAMPQLPDQSPFATSSAPDKETGISLRLTQGSTFGQNQTGWIYDSTWGSTLVPDYCMRIAFPANI